MLWIIACGSEPLYSPCSSGDKCGGDGCFQLLYSRSDGSEREGNFCSKRCTTDADCRDGVCLALSEDPDSNFLCFETCTPDSCFEGQVCTPVNGASVDRVCLP